MRIVIVTNGQPTEVRGRADGFVHGLIQKALDQTGNAGQPAEQWELRTRTGNIIEKGAKNRDYADATIFLNLRAGVGGSYKVAA